MTDTKLLSIRIPSAIADRLEAMAQDGRTKTAVTNDVLSRGLAQLDEEQMAAGFALLGDQAFQDIQFPTGAQLEALRLAD